MVDNKIEITEELRAAYAAARGNLMLFAGLLIGLNADAADFESAALLLATIEHDEIVDLVKEILDRTAL
jgi:hypothetical protein